MLEDFCFDTGERSSETMTNQVGNRKDVTTTGARKSLCIRVPCSKAGWRLSRELKEYLGAVLDTWVNIPLKASFLHKGLILDRVE
jgi:hypothetical protein